MRLDDKYTQQTGVVYLTGMQALVRCRSIRCAATGWPA
jgi:hypothetical protein